MKILFQFFIFFLITSAFFPLRSSADRLPELTNFIRSEIANANQAIPSPQGNLNAPADGYYLHNLFLRLQILVGINIPWIASFQLVPEVELVFERPIPVGWTTYER